MTVQLPKISIVTATFNAERFVEETIASVVEQGYPNLEYIVVDGGSSDGTTSIIQRFEERISYWVSEPDGGQYNTINKGFEKATGDVLAWLNADDMYCPWTLRSVGEVFAALPRVQWITADVGLRINEDGLVYKASTVPPHTRKRFLRGWKFQAAPLSQGWITQESTFWRRSLWERAGGKLDEAYSLAADFDLWARFWKLEPLRLVNVPLSLLRLHPERRGRIGHEQYREEALRSLTSHGGRLTTSSEARRRRLLERIPLVRRSLFEEFHKVRYIPEAGEWRESKTEDPVSEERSLELQSKPASTRPSESEARRQRRAQRAEATADMITVIKPSHGWISLDLWELWRYRELLYFLAWRDLKVRYKQTIIGAAWAVIQPLMTMVVFTIIFGRLAKLDTQGFPPEIFYYSGLVPWTLFATGLTQSANSLVGNSSLITKIYFPRFTVPAASIVASIADFLIAFAVLLLMCPFFDVWPTFRLLACIPLMLLAAMAALGVGLWLSAINVKFRDVRHLTGFIVNFWLYASPVAYPASLIESDVLRHLYYVNPMTGAVEGFRWAVLGTNTIEPLGVAISVCVAALVMVTGAFYFKRMERIFADVA